MHHSKTQMDINRLNLFLIVAKVLNKILFYEICHFPLIVIWLICVAVYFSVKLGFPNVRLFKHAIDVLKGKFYSEKLQGVIKPYQGLLMGASSTMGLGSIAGIAIAVSLAGPGSIIWIMIFGFFSMNLVFSEVVLSLKYRRINGDDVESGPLRYLRYGLADLGLKKLGFILASAYSILSVVGIVTSGATFQAHEAINVASDYISSSGSLYVLPLILSVFAFLMIRSTLETSIRVIEKIIPLMIGIYSTMGLFVIISRLGQIPSAILLMLKEAFNFKAVGAGLCYAIVMGARRSFMSNEAGLGNLGIAHGAAKTQHPVQQAAVSALNPCISTMLFSFLNGLIVVIGGLYLDSTHGNGVVLIKNSFSAACSWFPHIISFILLMIACCVIISFANYLKNIWIGLFDGKYLYGCYFLYSLAIFLSGFLNLDQLLIISENFFLAISIPNVIGLYLMRNVIKKECDDYIGLLEEKRME